MDEDKVAEVYTWDPAAGRYRSKPETLVLADDAPADPDAREWSDWVHPE